MNVLNKKDSKVAGFIFKAQLAQESLNHVNKASFEKSELSYVSISKKVSMEILDKELVAEATKMSAVYIVIASFENMLREIVTAKLLLEKGENWWTSNAISGEIRNKAKRKEDDEKLHRWHTARGVNPIYFTELKDLVSIICNENNWPFFEDLFGNSDWVRHSVKSLERSRNVIMHSGQLSIEDIERVGIVVRDWIRQIGS